MSFVVVEKNVPNNNIVQPDGNPELSELCIVGEAPGKTELRLRKPFVGTSGDVLNHCLHEAGIVRSGCYLTNFINEYVGSNIASGVNKYVNPKTGALTERGKFWQDNLAEELKNVKAPLIVTCGGPAMRALTGQWGIEKFRGYLCNALPIFNERPVLPTYHPASCLYGGNYVNKYVITHDFKKACHILEHGVQCDETEVHILDNFQIAIDFLECVLASWEVVSFDIEVNNYEVSSISLSCSQKESFSILFKVEGMWTLQEEVTLITKIAMILEDEKIAKIGQNLIFDMHFMLSKYGIYTRGYIFDTMIGHHIIYPDLKKGLGFLASILTNRPHWKDMVKFKNIKKEN